MAVTNYRELIAWQKAMDFAVELYAATEPLPKAEATAFATNSGGPRSPFRRTSLKVKAAGPRGSS